MPSAAHSASFASTIDSVVNDRSDLIPGTYKPDGSTTGQLPGWTTGMMTKIDASSANVSTTYNSPYANWPALVPPDNSTYVNTWFHIPVWIVPGRRVHFQNCIFDGYGIPNLIDNTASNYQTPVGAATDWACLDLSAVAGSGAAGNVKTNVVLEDCKIDPADPGDSVNGIRGCGYSLYRTKIVNCVDAIDLFRKGSNEELGVYIEASFISSLAYFNTVGNHSNNATHNDGIQWAGGHGWEMFGSTFEGIGWTNSAPGAAEPAPYYPAVGNCITMTPNQGPTTGMNIHDSWLDGGDHAFIAIVDDNVPASKNVNLGSLTNVTFGRRSHAASIQISSLLSLTSTNSTYEDDGSSVAITRGES